MLTRWGLTLQTLKADAEVALKSSLETQSKEHTPEERRKKPRYSPSTYFNQQYPE
jgi:hypothetical protein